MWDYNNNKEEFRKNLKLVRAKAYLYLYSGEVHANLYKSKIKETLIMIVTN